jgi:hypothetical protein
MTTGDFVSTASFGSISTSSSNNRFNHLHSATILAEIIHAQRESCGAE